MQGADMDGRSAAHGLFVILPSSGSSKRLRVGDHDHFKIEEVPELPGTYIARVKDMDVPDDKSRRRLQDFAGNDYVVSNVLEDAQGHTFIPTGNINVLLASPMPEDKLQQWAAANDLRLVVQSKWRPKSVVLQMDSDIGDVKDTLRKLRADPEVEVAEQEVLSKFKREASA
jgi:hypothetical protein